MSKVFFDVEYTPMGAGCKLPMPSLSLLYLLGLRTRGTIALPLHPTFQLRRGTVLLNTGCIEFNFNSFDRCFRIFY